MNKTQVRALRKQLGLNQKDFGEMIGFKPQTVSNYETGNMPISQNFRRAIIKMVEDLGIGYEILGEKLSPIFLQGKEIQQELQDQHHDIQELRDLPDTLGQAYMQDDLPFTDVPVESPYDWREDWNNMHELPTQEETDSLFPPHSEHYHNGKVDVLTWAQENVSQEEIRGFCRLSAMKYLGRYGIKEGFNDDDLDKAVFYTQYMKGLDKE